VAFDKLERASVTGLLHRLSSRPAARRSASASPARRQPPSATRRPLVAHFDCTDFDGDRPTLELLTAERTLLAFDQWPKDLAGGGIVANHPIFQRPFICRRGLRESARIVSTRTSHGTASARA
jgi:hypothetical protein